METSFAAANIRRFGAFELNLSTGELRKRGFRIALQEQPRRILMALLDAHGAIVSRATLCRLLWPEGTFVDFEHSLNAAVRRLRAALGEEADVPRYIETVPGHGYRFSIPQGRTRLAVLPFSVLDADSANDGFAARIFVDGLVDEITTQLARACPDGVGVVARTAVMRSGLPLGANYLVEGMVRRAGARVRITVHLTEAQEDTHVWAASYDRVLEDALTVQTDVAAAVSDAIAPLLNARRLGGELSDRERRGKRLPRIGARREPELGAGLEAGEGRLEKIVG